MRLFALLCILPLTLHLVLASPVAEEDSSANGKQATSGTTTSTDGDDKILDMLAKHSDKISKAEWKKIRGSMDRLGQVVAKKNEEVQKRKGHKSHKVYGSNKDPANAQRTGPMETNTRLGIHKYLFEGDMVLTSEQIEERTRANSNDNNSTRTKRQSLAAASSIWTMPIPYYFDSSATAGNIAAVRAAVALFQSKTCITFTESSTPITGRPAIRIYNAGGCISDVGMGTGITNCSPCEDVNTAAHELMHALGYQHEMSRSDRDNYINVDLSKVQPAFQYAFDKCTNCDNQGLDYDVNSNMHYTATFFTNNPGDVSMTADDPLYSNTVGGVFGPNYVDLKALNMRYNCAARCSGGATCNNGGYRNPANCNACNCKEGFNEANGCTGPATTCGATLSATSSWQSLSGGTTKTMPGPYNSGSPIDVCDYHIQAPAGQVVQVQIQSILTNQSCDGACYWGGTEFVHKWSSTTTSGFRVCCVGQIASQPIVQSDSQIFVIRPFSKIYPQSFQVQYRAVAPGVSLTVYDLANYGGSSKTYSVTSTCNSDMASTFNDITSSFTLSSGGCVELFGSSGCQGGSKTYTASTPSLAADGLDNTVSSFRACSVLTLFSDPNYGGSTKTYTITGSCNNDVASTFNDITSSIQLTSGCVELYGSANCIGGSKQYTANTASLAPDGLDNTVSSFRGCSSVVFYADPNYGGTTKTYSVTGACNSDLASTFNDQTSSLQVNGCVEIFDNSGCSGASKQYTANTASLTADGFDDRASSFRACSSVTFYADPNYGGVTHTYVVTSTCNSDIASTFNDNASSIQVTGCVQVFSDAGCTGISKQYIANTATLTSDIDKNASSFSACT